METPGIVYYIYALHRIGNLYNSVVSS